MQHPIQTHIDGIFLSVSDVRKAALWYCDLLGVVFEEASLQGSRYSFRVNGGQLWLTLVSTDQDAAVSRPAGALFNLSANDLDRALEHVRSMGARVTRQTTTLHPGLSFFEFDDPDGNALMVIARSGR